MDDIPEIPEAAAAGSASSGSIELPEASTAEPPPQIKLKELMIISRGTTPDCVQLTRRPPELQDPTWDVILKSLHKLDNPQRDKSLQAHVGINRRMILQLVQYAPMRTAVLKAASQALRSDRAIVIFECSQGRHRSVGAAGILYQILHPLVPKMKLLHASMKNWKGTCGGECPECRSGPPPAFHQEIEVLRNELLAQLQRDYMEPPALALEYSKQNESQCTCPARQVGDYGCQASQHLLNGLQVCPPCCNETIISNDCKTPFARNYLRYFQFKLSNKNQFQQKSAHTSKNRFESMQEQIEMNFLKQSMQVFRHLNLVAQSLAKFFCHESTCQPRNRFLNDIDNSLLGQTSNGSKLLMPALGISKGPCVFRGALQGGMDHDHFLDVALLQLVPPLPEPQPAITFEDFLIFEALHDYGNCVTIADEESLTTNEFRDNLIVTQESCSSPSWIGAQPDPDSDCESIPNHQDPNVPIADDASCAPTEIDVLSNCSSVTQPYCYPSPHSTGKKRKLHEEISNTPQKDAINQAQEQKEIDDALAFEICSPSYCNSHTTSRADRIQDFLVKNGPYPGWEFDEYPQTFDYSPDLSLCDSTTGSSRCSCGSDSDPRSGSNVFSPGRLPTPSDEGFWDHWILDSDGNFRPRPIGSPDYPATFGSYRSDPFDQVPTQDMIEIFEGNIAQPSDEPNSPSSHASLRPLRRDLYTAAGFDDCDDDHMQQQSFPTATQQSSVPHPDNNDDERQHAEQFHRQMMHGGANDGFQPSKADISKLVQKLKCVDHHFAPKQIRMLLVSDQKFMKKIERTSDAKQLLSCVQAAAVRMGLQVPEVQKPQDKGNANKGFSITNVPLPFSTHDGKGKGKNVSAPSDKGKSKGMQANTFQSPSENMTHKNLGKGKGKSKNQDAKNNAPAAAKSKGKGQTRAITYKLEPEGWNVIPLDTFVPSHGGDYVCEKLEQAKRIAEQGVGKNFPIGILSPFPMEIGVKAPEVIFAEFTKCTGEGSHRISMQAYLHQITYADVVYRRTAPSVHIQRPAIAHTSVSYLTITDEGACAQTKLELQQKRLPAFKQWISTLLQHNRKLDILDVWNAQQISKNEQVATYQVSARIASSQLESLLAMSSPGKLQVNVPGPLRLNMQHIWLKKEGRPMTPDEVHEVLADTCGKHLGAFCVRGTWALRMLNEHHEALKIRLGRDEDPAYFISNLPPDMEADSVRELLAQLHWHASVKDGERRWKGAGYTWLVRSKSEPRVWEFPINYGYERRMVRIQAARRPKSIPPVAVPENVPLHFPSWKAQCRTGRHQPKPTTTQPTYVDMVNAARKRPKTNGHLDVKVPDENESLNSDEDMEQSGARQDKNFRLQEQLQARTQHTAEQQSESAKLHEQMQAMAKQNAEQQQLIQTLTKQIAELTQQLQLLTAQSLAAGATTAQEHQTNQDHS